MAAIDTEVIVRKQRARRTVAVLTATSAMTSLVLIAGAAPAGAVGVTSAALVSTTTAGAPILGSNEEVAISGNGRYVVFTTDADGIYSTDDNLSLDVFRKDLLTGQITPISIDDNNTFGDADSYAPSISDDGNVVGFISDSDSLDLRDSNGSPDLYVRDVAAGTTKLAFVCNATFCPDDTGSSPLDGVWEGAISGDGKNVVFTTTTALLSTDLNDSDDVFARKLTGTTVVRISRSQQSGNPEGGGGNGGAISDDGRFVVFESLAPDILTTADAGAKVDVYVYDRDTDANGTFDQTGKFSVARASLDTANGLPNGHSTAPAITPDGRYVVFHSVATDLVASPANASGIFVRDRQTSTTTWASVTSGAPNGTFSNPAISDNGRYVAFDSSASNVVAGDSGAVVDVFRRDRTLGTTARVSIGLDGAVPNGLAFDPSISDDGTLVAFAAAANNLVPVDGNPDRDAFVWSPPNDTTAPTVTMRRPAGRYAVAGLTAEWYGFDTSSIASFDVQWRVTRYNQANQPWSYWLTNTASTSRTYNASTGRTYCFRARADDTASNTSAFTLPACAAIPLRANEIAYTSGWTRYDLSYVYGGVAFKATTSGRTATRSSVAAERVAIVATKCSGCGSITVTFGGTSKTISLDATSTLRKQVIEVLTFSSPRTGTLTIKTTTNKPVIIEGLGLYQD